MSMLRSSVFAVVATAALGVGAASACQTSDLAGEWFATYNHGAPGYCTLTFDATGAVTASACWVEKLKTDPMFVLAGAFTADEACKVTAALTAAAPTSSSAAFAKAAAAAKSELKGKRKGGHGGGGDGKKTGDGSVTVAGRLLTGNELINGLVVRANGAFEPVSFTRSK